MSVILDMAKPLHCSGIADMVTKGDCNLKPREIETVMYSQKTFDSKIGERVSLLYSAWSASFNESMGVEGELLHGLGVRRSNVPKAPHLENCKLSSQVKENLDKRVENESFPPWTLWKGFLHTDSLLTAGERLKSEGAYPPWVRMFPRYSPIRPLLFVLLFKLSL